MDDVQGELLTAKFAKKIRKGREEIQAPTLHTDFPKPTEPFAHSVVGTGTSDPHRWWMYH